jgi:hypothetical protein
MNIKNNENNNLEVKSEDSSKTLVFTLCKKAIKNQWLASSLCHNNMVSVKGVANDFIMSTLGYARVSSNSANYSLKNFCPTITNMDGLIGIATAYIKKFVPTMAALSAEQLAFIGIVVLLGRLGNKPLPNTGKFSTLGSGGRTTKKDNGKDTGIPATDFADWYIDNIPAFNQVIIGKKFKEVKIPIAKTGTENK